LGKNFHWGGMSKFLLLQGLVTFDDKLFGLSSTCSPKTIAPIVPPAAGSNHLGRGLGSRATTSHSPQEKIALPPPSLHQTQSDAGSLRHVTFLIRSVLSDVQQIGLKKFSPAAGRA
jgi:hypothetical protein